ncbi:shTK domain protein [Ancylostoma caninum]|uniref:ShTK domain protein n=1 Tax=Ancylostoma caninum TaxID=29170 RepID=A0A368F948_ANCCA|nr:shTK domain protein [Ancylostoma caninum]
MMTIISFFVFLAASSSALATQLRCGTGAESTCCDKDPSCEYRARIGQCSNKNMLIKCQLSCHSCKTDSSGQHTEASRELRQILGS